jgi:glycosyltransferase involved in cell wall biosynthesis
MGGGTRLKVVEGLAMAKPMVSTTIGCEGIDVRPGEHLLVADAPDEFADAVVRVLRDPALGRRLGVAGNRLARTRYSWEGAVDKLGELYDRLTAVPANRSGD